MKDLRSHIRSSADSTGKASSSLVLVIFNFVNTALGGSLGLMGNILSASKLGIVWFVAGSAVSMMTTYFSIQFLCQSAELSRSASTHRLAHHYLGPKGSLITKLFVFLGNWSFITNIIQIWADFLPDILLGSWFNVDASSPLTSRWLAVSIGLLLISPWVLVKDISKLERLSTLCIVFAVFIFVVLVLNATNCAIHDNVSDSVQILVTDPRAIFYGLPTIAWCWSLQFNVIPIYLTLSRQHRVRQMPTVSRWTVGSLFVFYGALGIAAYVVWGGGVDSDFIDNLSVGDPNFVFYLKHWLSTLTQFVICLSSFCSIPVFAFESRTNLHSLLLSAFKMCCQSREQMHLQRVHDEDSDREEDDDPDIETADISSLFADGMGLSRSGGDSVGIGIDDEMETNTSRMVEGVAILTTAALVALLVSDLSLCLTICGATYGCFISFLLPSVVYLKALQQMQNAPLARELTTHQMALRVLAVISIILGSFVCVAGVTSAVM